MGERLLNGLLVTASLTFGTGCVVSPDKQSDISRQTITDNLNKKVGSGAGFLVMEGILESGEKDILRPLVFAKVSGHDCGDLEVGTSRPLEDSDLLIGIPLSGSLIQEVPELVILPAGQAEITSTDEQPEVTCIAFPGSIIDGVSSGYILFDGGVIDASVSDSHGCLPIAYPKENALLEDLKVGPC